jgi:hypothetical protein
MSGLIRYVVNSRQAIGVAFDIEDRPNNEVMMLHVTLFKPQQIKKNDILKLQTTFYPYNEKGALVIDQPNVIRENSVRVVDVVEGVTWQEYQCIKAVIIS